MRYPETSEARLRRLPWRSAALPVLLLGLTFPVLAGSEAPAGAPAEPKQPAPVLPIVNGELLRRLPRRDHEYRPADGMVPGLVTADRVWQLPPPRASFVDPANGAVYYPGMSFVQLTALDVATGKPIVIYFTVPNSSAPRDPAYYQALLARAVAGAARAAEAERMAAQAAVQAPQAPAAPAVQQPGRFASRLAPMLGGPEEASMQFVVGEVRLRQGKAAEAALAFGKSAAEPGGGPAPLLARAIALMAQGDHVGAADSLRQGLGGLADWYSLHLNWSAVFADAAMAQSVEDNLRAKARADPADQDAVLVLAFYYFAARQDAMAVDVLRRAVDARDPLLGNMQAAAERRLRAAADGQRAEP